MQAVEAELVAVHDKLLNSFGITDGARLRSLFVVRRLNSGFNLATNVGDCGQEVTICVVKVVLGCDPVILDACLDVFPVVKLCNEFILA